MIAALALAAALTASQSRMLAALQVPTRLPRGFHVTVVQP
jgi:hypothetical protein